MNDPKAPVTVPVRGGKQHTEFAKFTNRPAKESKFEANRD